MPYKDPIKDKRCKAEWYQKHKESSRQKRHENSKRYYERIKADPERLKKFNETRRKYYHKLRAEHPEKIKSYTEKTKNKTMFGGHRGEVLLRDSYKCRICNSTERLNIHHIDGKGYGLKNPNNSVENLITLCHLCHRSIHSFSKIKNSSLAKVLVNLL